MGQNQYADWFINGMLGWIRWIAGNIAGMFQTSSSHTSSGSNMIGWFADNWIKLLLFMIVFGLLVDWTIWMVRWRPYWLWFHKKRILLDDDIDLALSDEELMRRYAPDEYHQLDAQRHPHFKGSNLGKQSGDNVDALYSDDEYDEDYEIPDIEDPYLGEDPLEAHALHEDIPEIEIDEDDDYMPEPRQPKERRRRFVSSHESDEDYENERNEFDALYLDGYNDGPYGEDDEDDEDEDDSDDDEPDISFISGDEKRKSRSAEDKNKKSGWLSRLARRKQDENEEEEDPFSVAGDLFEDSYGDDNFNSTLAASANNAQDVHFRTDDDEDDRQKTPAYSTPAVKISKRRTRDLEISSELTPSAELDDDDDRLMSYSAVAASVAPRPQPNLDLNPDSRRARRQRRERTDD